MDHFLNTDYTFPKQYPFQQRKSDDNLDGATEMEIAKDVSYSLAHDLNTSLREKKTRD